MRVWKELKKYRLAYLAFWTLLLFYLLAIFADFFSPYHYADEEPSFSWHPPTPVHLFSLKQKIFRPYIYGYKSQRNPYYQRVYQVDKEEIIPLRFLVRGFKYKLLGIWETDIHLFGVDKARIYLFGADLKGRDIFSRLLYGARISLSVAFFAALLSFFLGLIVGGVSGYFGGRIDTVMMRLVEMIMLFPSFYLLLALRASFPPEIKSSQVYLLTILILSFIGWAYSARIIRGMALSLRERDFVLAAKSLGVSNLRIIFTHILPHTLSYSLAAICLSIPGYILGETALSLIGLGIQEPEASWGNMLVLAEDIVSIQFYPWVLFSGIAIILVSVLFNLVGDALRDILDPKRRIL